MLSQTSFYRKLSVITSTYLLLMYCVLRVHVCVCSFVYIYLHSRREVRQLYGDLKRLTHNVKHYI